MFKVTQTFVNPFIGINRTGFGVEVSVSLPVGYRHVCSIDNNIWSHHQMETFRVTGALMVFFIFVWINGWANNCEAGDLRRYNYLLVLLPCMMYLFSTQYTVHVLLREPRHGFQNIGINSWCCAILLSLPLYLNVTDHYPPITVITAATNHHSQQTND